MKISPLHFLLKKQEPFSKALISSNQSYTFDELRKKVLTTSQIFINNDVKPNERIGILSYNDMDFVINILASWQISAVPVPINVRLTKSEIVQQLMKAGCKKILVKEELADKIDQGRFQIIKTNFDKAVDINFPEKNDLRLEDTAVIIFTSGSENHSKGVEISFQSLFNSAVNGDHLLRYSHSDRWLASLPFYHIGGFSIITRALTFGIPIIIPDSISFDDISRAMIDFHPTYISLVSAQLKQFVDKKISPNAELKHCLLGGGFTDNDLIKKAIELGWPINIVYGSTETSSFVTALLTDEFLAKPNSVGRPLPGNKIIIGGTNQEELKSFEVGEIIIESNALMSGYINDDMTNPESISKYFSSGDFGYLDEDNYLYIEGRKSYKISSGGENVNAKEVEKALLQHPEILEAAVFPLKDEEWGEIVAAALVLKSKTKKLTHDELKSFLQKIIAGFKIPKKIFFEEELPKTELGKVQKDKLISRYML